MMKEDKFYELYDDLKELSPIGAMALRYAYRLRLYLLPVFHPDDPKGPEESKGKTPISFLVQNGLRNTSNDPDKIFDWWIRKQDANIGVVPGKSNLLGIDIDGPAGEESLKKLEEELGPLPETWRVRTGRIERGEHLYFRVPENLRITNSTGLYPGIDLRHSGGYLILPPSVHASGQKYKT